MIVVPAPVDDRPEVCDDRQDNDGDGFVDCADEACATAPECEGAPAFYQQESGAVIPDHDPTGLVSKLIIPNQRLVNRLAITVELVHQDPSELRITAGQAGSSDVVLWDHQAAPSGTFKRTFLSGDYALQTISGAFQITIVDTRAGQVGTLIRWGVEVLPCVDGESCTNGYLFAGSDQAQAVPDGDPAGMTSTVVVPESRIEDISVSVTIDHPAGG